MKISINVSELRHHLSHLKEEELEAKKLFRLLDNWELAEPDRTSCFFINLREGLQKQREMICQRIDMLEVFIEEFTVCIHTMEKALLDSNNCLHAEINSNEYIEEVFPR